MEKIILAFCFFIFNAFLVQASASEENKEMAPIPLQGGVVAPNSIFKISLTQALIKNRYYEVTCDIENQNYTSDDPVIMKLSYSYYDPTYGGRGGVGEITVNGHQLVHDQILLDKLENDYLALDIYTSVSGVPYTFDLTFENFNLKHSVTVKNCYADYMHD